MITLGLNATQTTASSVSASCTPVTSSDSTSSSTPNNNSPADVQGLASGATTVLDQLLHDEAGEAIENDLLFTVARDIFLTEVKKRLDLVADLMEVLIGTQVAGVTPNTIGTRERLDYLSDLQWELRNIYDPDERLEENDLEVINRDLAKFGFPPLDPPPEISSIGSGQPDALPFAGETNTRASGSSEILSRRIQINRSSHAYNLAFGRRAVPAKFFANVRLTGLTSDLKGHSVDGRVGVVALLSKRTHVGAFLSGNEGSVENSGSNFQLKRTGFGGGLFAASQMRSGVSANASASFYRFNNDVISNGATGGFNGNLFIFKAGAGISRNVGRFVVSTHGSMGVTHRNFESYTLSDGTAIPSASATGFISSLSARASRTFVNDGFFERITPFAAAGIHYNSLATDIVTAGATSVNLSKLTGSISGGVGMGANNGADLDLSATLSGIGSGVNSISGLAKFSMPLN